MSKAQEVLSILERNYSQKIELFWYVPNSDDDPETNVKFNWNKHYLFGTEGKSTAFLNWDEKGNWEIELEGKILLKGSSRDYDREKIEAKLNLKYYSKLKMRKLWTAWAIA